MGERSGRASILAVSQNFAIAGRLWRDYLKSLENGSGVPQLTGIATQKVTQTLHELRCAPLFRASFRHEPTRYALMTPLHAPISGELANSTPFSYGL